jgi:hypothetical protein
MAGNRKPGEGPLNLETQAKNFGLGGQGGGSSTEVFTYDEFQRIRTATRTWGGAGLPTSSQTDAYSYDDLGNWS